MKNILAVSEGGFCYAGGRTAKYFYASHGVHILEMSMITPIMRPLSLRSRWLVKYYGYTSVELHGFKYQYLQYVYLF